MAIADMADMVARLKAIVPSAWFSTSAPVKDAILAGIGWVHAQIHALIVYVKLQGRVSSAADVFLDIAARDYTGTRVTRRLYENDESFRVRLSASLLPSGATRTAMMARLASLSGTTPKIFEPTQPMDTGAYGYGGLGYNLAGGYGSINLPFQAFVRVKRPVSQGVPYWAGYNGNRTAPPYAPGGYNLGLIAYSDITQAFGGVTDADIYQAIADVQPLGAIAWTQIHA